jgi:hypothetical protein
MGANPIAWRRVKTLNRRMNERFVHASTSSHHEGGVHHWLCIRHDGTAVYVNPQTLESEPVDTNTTTMSLLRSRDARWSGQAEWLAELDERQTELDSPGPASLPLAEKG